MLPAYLDGLATDLPAVDWAVCAFGANENECLIAATAAGGKAGIGFETNLIGPDGDPAPDNASQIHGLRRRCLTSAPMGPDRAF